MRMKTIPLVHRLTPLCLLLSFTATPDTHAHPTPSPRPGITRVPVLTTILKRAERHRKEVPILTTIFWEADST